MLVRSHIMVHDQHHWSAICRITHSKPDLQSDYATPSHTVVRNHPWYTIAIRWTTLHSESDIGSLMFSRVTVLTMGYGEAM